MISHWQGRSRAIASVTKIPAVVLGLVPGHLNLAAKHIADRDTPCARSKDMKRDTKVARCTPQNVCEQSYTMYKFETDSFIVNKMLIKRFII